MSEQPSRGRARGWLRTILAGLGVSVMAVGSFIAASPSAFASPSITVNAPGIQYFSSWPGSWFLLNQPDEFVVTPATTPTTAISQSQSSTIYSLVRKSVTRTVAQTTQTWVNTSHNVSYQYWVMSGHEATGHRWISTSHWVTSGYYQSYQYWVNTSHWASYRYWVNTSHWVPWQYWHPGHVIYAQEGKRVGFNGVVQEAYSPSWGCRWEYTSVQWKARFYSCWYDAGWSPGYYTDGRKWISSGYWATSQRWVTSGYDATGQRWINTSHEVTSGYWQPYSYYVNTSHWATGQRWVTSGYWQPHTTYSQVTTLVPVWVPTVTTVSAQGLTVTNSTLIGVQPAIQDTTLGTYWHQEWYGNFCYGGETPLVNPSSPQFPNYSGSLWNYTFFFESQHICTFNPSYVPNNDTQSWQIAQNMARMLLIPKWSVTVHYTQTTSVNGVVTSSVPQTVTETVNGPTFNGPPWTIAAYTGVSCPETNGIAYCPGRAPIAVPK